MIKEFVIFKRLRFWINTGEWVFPVMFHLTCVGSNYRPYTFSLVFLCFRLIFCIDEDSYLEEIE